MPLSAFLRAWFAREKKFGSRDRKCIAQLCYCYYRAGNLVKELPLEKAILSALFLCSHESNEVLEAIEPRCNQSIKLDTEEKLTLIGLNKHASDIFPYREELSDGIDFPALCLSTLAQPNLFIRIRPGFKNTVLGKLDKAGIHYAFRKEDCLAMLNNTKLDGIIAFNREAVVQDMNSQRSMDLVHPDPEEGGIRIWDCCAGSGGKSILAIDRLGNMDLTVSDIRESILINLKKRFFEAGIRNYQSFLADLSQPIAHCPLPTDKLFDLVICDAPCTGSGTWGRTPEQLYYFKADEIEDFAQKQKMIAENAWKQLKPGGQFLYITCSLFKKENEDVIYHLIKKFHSHLMGMELLRGYKDKADTLFTALLQKPSD